MDLHLQAMFSGQGLFGPQFQAVPPDHDAFRSGGPLPPLEQQQQPSGKLVSYLASSLALSQASERASQPVRLPT